MRLINVIRKCRWGLKTSYKYLVSRLNKTLVVPKISYSPHIKYAINHPWRAFFLTSRPFKIMCQQLMPQAQNSCSCHLAQAIECRAWHESSAPFPCVSQAVGVRTRGLCVLSRWAHVAGNFTQCSLFLSRLPLPVRSLALKVLEQSRGEPHSHTSSGVMSAMANTVHGWCFVHALMFMIVQLYRWLWDKHSECYVAF